MTSVSVRAPEARKRIAWGVSPRFNTTEIEKAPAGATENVSLPKMKGPYTPNPDVVFKRLEDRMVLVHLTTSQIFELNHTGARVWELLQEGVSGDTLLDRLKAEFEIDPATLRTEIESLLSELTSEGLIAS